MRFAESRLILRHALSGYPEGGLEIAGAACPAVGDPRRLP